MYEQPPRINCSIWLDASQRSRDGVWVNRSVWEVKCKALWTVLRTGRYIRTCLYKTFSTLKYEWNVCSFAVLKKGANPLSMQNTVPPNFSWHFQIYQLDFDLSVLSLPLMCSTKTLSNSVQPTSQQSAVLTVRCFAISDNVMAGNESSKYQTIDNLSHADKLTGLLMLVLKSWIYGILLRADEFPYMQYYIIKLIQTKRKSKKLHII